MVRMRGFACVVIAVGLACLFSGEAEAQFFQGPARNQPGRRPTISPYVAVAAANNNVQVSPTGSLGGGINAALAATNAYANITRPGMEQQRMQAQQAGLGRQVNRLQSQVRGTKLSAADLASGMLISQTGKAATYSNYSHYYPNKQRR